jgi:HK97 family phage major capsid protein
MDEKTLEELEKRFTNVVDKVFEEKMKVVVGEVAAQETRKIVEQMRVERLLFGQDRSGLSEEQKLKFVDTVKAALGARTKANEALIEEQDNRGGYLVAKEVADAILRIAASVGLVLSQCQKWPMKTDELGIPAYTGSFLEGEYLSVDAAGSVTGVTFTQARLIVKKWQLAFAVGNDLLADAGVNLADWLLALGAEALANRIDKEGLAGTGAPFVGVINESGCTTFTMPSGETGFDKFSPVADAADVIGNVEESILDGCGWMFNRTVWAKIRQAKDAANAYILAGAGAITNDILAAFAGKIGGAKPVGAMAGYPVFTCKHLPGMTASAVSTIFGIFGNLKALNYGDKGELRVGQYQSGSFGGKEIALADQTGLVYKHRHALVIGLPAAFVNIKTAAS